MYIIHPQSVLFSSTNTKHKKSDQQPLFSPPPPPPPPPTQQQKPQQIRILNARHFAKIAKDKRALFLNHTNYLVLSLFWGSLFSYSAGA